GNFDRLAFMNDDDANVGGISQFRNIELYEADKLTININGNSETNSLQTYGNASVLNGKSSPQDTSRSIVTYDDHGNEAKIKNNGWKQLAINNYNITANTVLNFEFRSTSQGEIQGIGFDNNDNVFDNTNTLFQLYGTQTWGNQAFNNYAANDNWKAYSINVGDYFTGNFDRLAFMNDDDANVGGISQFRNIVLSEEVPNSMNVSSDPLTGLVETKTGTPNADIFALGDINKAFYDSYGEQDYADIVGFNSSQDTIQLHGIANDYYLGSSPFGSNDLAIFLKVAGMDDELVGVVKGTNNLDLNSSAFAFV
ncbi:hypothetical protein VB691_09495, partial [Crocosphaera sp. XPORK-15E]|nr:hypothetical protein [Crocosphaera sp. XPORK-15E]